MSFSYFLVILVAIRSYISKLTKSNNKDDLRVPMSKGQVFPYGFGQIGGTIEIVSDLCLTLVIYIFKQNFLSARMANLMELEQEDI